MSDALESGQYDQRQENSEHNGAEIIAARTVGVGRRGDIGLIRRRDNRVGRHFARVTNAAGRTTLTPTRLARVASEGDRRHWGRVWRIPAP